jgi:hypothetical protein
MTAKWHNRGRNNGKVGHPNSVLTTAERFEIKVDRSGECHRWTGAHNSAGYGNFFLGGRTRSAHIVALLLAGVEVPEGMTVDHVWDRGCRHRDCVRVDHLEIVPFRTNVLRSNNAAAVGARRTHCPSGHEYTPENTYNNSRGHRFCRTCAHQRGREWRLKRIAELKADAPSS